MAAHIMSTAPFLPVKTWNLDPRSTKEPRPISAAQFVIFGPNYPQLRAPFSLLNWSMGHSYLDLTCSHIPTSVFLNPLILTHIFQVYLENELLR